MKKLTITFGSRKEFEDIKRIISDSYIVKPAIIGEEETYVCKEKIYKTYISLSVPDTKVKVNTCLNYRIDFEEEIIDDFYVYRKALSELCRRYKELYEGRKITVIVECRVVATTDENDIEFLENYTAKSQYMINDVSIPETDKQKKLKQKKIKPLFVFY